MLAPFPELHISAGESNICAVVGRVQLLTDLILWLCRGGTANVLPPLPAK